MIARVFFIVFTNQVFKRVDKVTDSIVTNLDDIHELTTTLMTPLLHLEKQLTNL